MARVALINDWDRFQLLHSLKNCGRALVPTSPTLLGGNYRITEMQAALLLAQMEQIEEKVNRRDTNGLYLSERISDIPGVTSMRPYPQVTRQSHYGYPFRYDSSAWEAIPCAVFRKALAAEVGLSVNTTYEPLTDSPLYQPHSKRRYHLSDEYWDAIDPRRYDLPVVNGAYEDEAVIIPHSFLLASRDEVGTVADAVEKLYDNRAELAH